MIYLNMNDLNENPFAKNTQVAPFSSATDAEIWQENNCHKCIKYECESKTEESAKCKLAFNLDLGYLDVKDFGKGYVWVNGRNLGRYWNAGPQTRLFCPGVWLKKGNN